MVLQLFRCLIACLTGRQETSRQGEGARKRAGEAAALGQPRQPEDTLPDALRPLLAIPGIGPKTVRYLAEGGYTSVADVRAASEEDLAAVEGVGPRAAEVLKQALAK